VRDARNPKLTRWLATRDGGNKPGEPDTRKRVRPVRGRAIGKGVRYLGRYKPSLPQYLADRLFYETTSHNLHDLQHFGLNGWGCPFGIGGQKEGHSGYLLVVGRETWVFCFGGIAVKCAVSDGCHFSSSAFRSRFEAVLVGSGATKCLVLTII